MSIKKDDKIETMQQAIKSTEEVIHLFNTKETDNDWSFIEYKPSDTGKSLWSGRGPGVGKIE